MIDVLEKKQTITNTQPEKIESYTENHQEDRPIEDFRSKVLLRIAYLSMGIFIFLMLMFSFVPISLEQQFQFTIKSDQKDLIYRFPEVVYVNEFFVKAGQNLKPDMPLVKITSPEIADLIAQYQHAAHSLENFYQHDTLLYHSERRNLELALREVQLSIKKYLGDQDQKEIIQKQELQRSQAQAQEALRRWEVGQKLYGSKSISEMELKDLEQQKIKSQTQLEIAQSDYKIQLNHLNHELESLEISEKQLLEKLSKLRLEEQKQEAALKASFDNIFRKIKLTYGSFSIEGENLVLLAEGKGKVAYLLDTEKEVNPTAILLKITENPSEIYAYTSVSPQTVSYIKPHQKAYLKVSTFPHYEWGMLKGEVKSVSLSPDANGLYPFQIQLNDKGKIGNLLQTGMTGNMSVVVEERTIFGLVFRKFNIWKDEKIYGIPNPDLAQNGK